MSKLYNYTLYFNGKATYTAISYEEALSRLSDEHRDVDVYDCDREEFDEYDDDYMG